MGVGTSPQGKRLQGLDALQGIYPAGRKRLSHKLEIEPELLKKYFRINIKAMCGGGLVSDQPIS